MRWELTGTIQGGDGTRRIVLEADDRASATRRAGRRGMEVMGARVIDPSHSTAGWTRPVADVPRNATPRLPATQEGSPDRMFCPNWSCKYVGAGRAGRRFSTPWFALLLLLGIVPGVVYAVTRRGKTLTCPLCGAWVLAT